MLYPLSYERMSIPRTLTTGDNLKTIPVIETSPRRAGVPGHLRDTLLAFLPPFVRSCREEISRNDADSPASNGSASAPATDPQPLAPTTTGSDGIASGTQTVIEADAPVAVSGNAISVLARARRPRRPSRRPGNSSPAAANMTPLFGSTLASAGTNALPFLALSLLLALAGLGLVLRRGAGRRGLLTQ